MSKLSLGTQQSPKAFRSNIFKKDAHSTLQDKSNRNNATKTKELTESEVSRNQSNVSLEKSRLDKSEKIVIFDNRRITFEQLMEQEDPKSQDKQSPRESEQRAEKYSD